MPHTTPLEASDLVGYGSILHRDEELLFAEVEIARAADRALVARGSVDYRIVVPRG